MLRTDVTDDQSTLHSPEPQALGRRFQRATWQHRFTLQIDQRSRRMTVSPAASSPREPIELFREVALVAPGSFGFLHTYDDEHLEEQYRFMKWTIVQQRITVEEDHALTPVVRTWYDGRDPRTTD